MAVSKKPNQPPAKTPQARENQLIMLATDLAEKQIREGTASAQVLTHYLKLGSVRETLEREKLQKENALLEARVENLANSGVSAELYERALKAMSQYQGRDESDDMEY